MTINNHKAAHKHIRISVSMSHTSKAVIARIHTSLGLTTPSQNTIQHMASALDGGGLTEECLRASLVRSDAYRTSVRMRFRETCYSLLGDDDNDAFIDFDSSISVTSLEPAEVSDEQIQNAVRQGSSFEARYLDLVNRNYSMLMNGEPPSEAFQSSMVSRFRRDPSFELEDLQEIIRSMSLSGESMEHAPALASAIACPQIFTEPDEPLTLTPETCVGLCQDNVRQIVMAGDREYGRPWYALELVAYITECLEIDDKDDLALHITKLSRDHLVAWEQAKSVHARLLGDVLEEIDFIRKYVGRHRTGNFVSSLTYEILSSSLYEHRIKGTLSSVQVRMYDIALSEDELDRLCLQARSMSVGVSEDEISTLLHAHRRECDAMISVVVCVFVDVLSREPDTGELVSEVGRFRAVGDLSDAQLEACRIDLAVRLSKSYEFHDVIKTRLRSAFHAFAGEHVPLQVLYVMLEQVLNNSEATLRFHGGAPGLVALVEREVKRASVKPIM